MRRALCALLLSLTIGCATSSDQTVGEMPMQVARGEFEVQLKPQPPDASRQWAPGRMLIDKQFRGDLEGTGIGEMLTVMTDNEGSAGYVAIERITGTLGGRAGSFALQHSGTMTRGTPSLSVTVVPDSGTGELAGLSGEMEIDLSGGKHAYTFNYRLP